MNNQTIKQIAGKLEDLSENLNTVQNLMLAADETGVSVAKCAGLVRMIQEQMQTQVIQLYSCQGENNQ